MPFEIGLKDVYDKLVALEDRWDERWEQTSVKLAELHLRVQALEQRSTKWAPWAAMIVSVGVGAIGWFVK